MHQSFYALLSAWWSASNYGASYMAHINKKWCSESTLAMLTDANSQWRRSIAFVDRSRMSRKNKKNTPFCTPNRRLFIWFRHIAFDSVTISLGLNRGSHYKLVHTCLTKRTTVWLGSYNRQRAFNFGSGFSIVKVECPLSIIWPKSNCGALRHSSVH